MLSKIAERREAERKIIFWQSVGSLITIVTFFAFMYAIFALLWVLGVR